MPGLSPADEARKVFVEGYRKYKKGFLSALINLAGGLYTTPEEVRDSVLRVLADIDAPARLWDGCPDDRQILWDSFMAAITTEAENLEQRKEEILSFHLSCSALAPTDTTVPASTVVATDDDSDDDSIGIPDTLYHATLRSNSDAIEDEGLQPMRRRCVTLHPTPDAAKNVVLGRHTDDENEIVILEIDAQEMLSQGLQIEPRDYGHGQVYETSEVLSQFITFGVVSGTDA